MILLIKKILKISSLLFIALVILVFSFHFVIESQTKHKTFSELKDLNHNRVGLVLGTSKFLGNGNVNLFFAYRIQATLDLYHHHKIDFVLVSGDNGRKSYDEPTDFKEALIKGGIPEAKIYLDYAGFRTLDSVVRAKEIFGLNTITFISQKFHNQRAIYLANQFGIEAIGYNAKEVLGRNGKKVLIREYFARTKVFIDLILGVKPKYLGKSIDIV